MQNGLYTETDTASFRFPCPDRQRQQKRLIILTKHEPPMPCVDWEGIHSPEQSLSPALDDTDQDV